MNLNHPRWEGHQFNYRRSNPVHYNNSAEWASLSSDKGQLNMEPGNHALSDDRHGLVINHLNEVSRYIDQESLHQFVEEVNKVEERLGYVKKNR